MYYLVCTSQFGPYTVGQVIIDAQTIAGLLQTNVGYFVQISQSAINPYLIYGSSYPQPSYVPTFELLGF